jgi:hypothetical protein
VNTESYFLRTADIVCRTSAVLRVTAINLRCTAVSNCSNNNVTVTWAAGSTNAVWCTAISMLVGTVQCGSTKFCITKKMDVCIDVLETFQVTTLHFCLIDTNNFLFFLNYVTDVSLNLFLILWRFYQLILIHRMQLQSYLYCYYRGADVIRHTKAIHNNALLKHKAIKQQIITTIILR